MKPGIPMFLCAVLAGCASPAPAPAPPGEERLVRHGDEIVAAGEFFRIGAPVVLWLDPDGYDAYRVERRFAPPGEESWEASRAAVPTLTTPNRYGERRPAFFTEEQRQRAEAGWDLDLLREVVDQVVLHYDAAGTSRECFRILHDVAGLSAHFLIDLDGVIYQTLDLKERAWHATISNTRSIGIEIANIGAYPVGERNPFADWYRREQDGGVRVTIPERLGDGGIRTEGFVGRPVRAEPVRGTIHGKEYLQYDLTAEQYESLIRLTAALSRIFPKIEADFPRDDEGNVVMGKLPDDALAAFRGLIGHFHIQTNKIDPGPAFQWDRVVDGARVLLGEAQE